MNKAKCTHCQRELDIEWIGGVIYECGECEGSSNNQTMVGIAAIGVVDTITNVREYTPEELEIQRIQRLPLIAKIVPREVDTAYNEQSTEYKFNEMLDILEEQGLLRTK
jgi:hypothetical protein